MIAYNAIAPNLVKEVDMDLGAEEGKKIKVFLLSTTIICNFFI